MRASPTRMRGHRPGSSSGNGYSSHGGSGSIADDDDPSKNFKVVIRVRPPLPRELNGEQAFQNVVRVESNERSITVSEDFPRLSSTVDMATAMAPSSTVRPIRCTRLRLIMCTIPTATSSKCTTRPQKLSWTARCRATTRRYLPTVKRERENVYDGGLQLGERAGHHPPRH